jgi:Amt family ammonium transporter
VLCVGLFASQDVEGFWKQGLLLGGGADQLVSQVIGVAAILAWVSVTSAALFYGIKAFHGLRVSEDEELMGLDVLEHGSPGYGEGFGSFTIDTPLAGNGETATDEEPVTA